MTMTASSGERSLARRDHHRIGLISGKISENMECDWKSGSEALSAKFVIAH
jgi:hypothetical protein